MFTPFPHPPGLYRVLKPGLVLFWSLLGFHWGHAADAQTPVSYYREIRPIFQMNCQGCHQPAKAKGGYVMTDFARLLVGGDTEGRAIVPGDPGQSALLKMVQPENGEVRMPKGKSPLTETEIALISRWVTEGAHDDTPLDAKRHYDADHPPVYSHLPVVTALDFSPDGQWLAVAGFHEVLLYDVRTRELAARLIGVSERVQSLRFSPDGSLLAAAAGDPGRSGELQLWDVEKRRLALSVPVTFDTLYGVSWSPDGKLVGFGCADNTVRAIEAASGKQVLQMGSHNDWVLSTAFSTQGDHLLSGGRDMSVKLTELASQRFVDNVTSITPGALKGGVLSLSTHPKLDHVVAAGSDGLPRVYRIFRETKREIGDDAQFIAELFPMKGRVFSVRFSADGRRIACGSSLDRTGEILVSTYDYTDDVPKTIRAIMGKVPGTRTPEERKSLVDYARLGIRELSRAAIPDSAIYSVAFNPEGDVVAAAGSDGNVRLINATNGVVLHTFASVPLSSSNSPPDLIRWAPAGRPVVNNPAPAPPESVPGDVTFASLEVFPPDIHLRSASDYVQLVVLARTGSGEIRDATRLVHLACEPGLVAFSSGGTVHPVKDGTGRIIATLGSLSSPATVQVEHSSSPIPDDFVRDVSPILARAGCNAGTCHGAKDGKNGFKLSLRGYDPEADLRSLTDDLAGRRVNPASPDDSLMLLKAVAEIPHEGGRRMNADSPYYRTLRQWIASGATLDLGAARATNITLFPQNPVVEQIGARQQFRVAAHYADGTTRDVTKEAFIDSGNTDVAVVDGQALFTALRRGEAPILTRFEGNYATTTITIMGDRSGFTWQAPPVWGRVDELVAAKWERMKINPSELCTDTEFVRRIHLDLTGRPPAPEVVRAFLADARAGRQKRDEMIDRLIGSPEFVEFWANKWADLLQCTSKFLGREGVETFREWIRQEVERNTPYDQFVRALLTSSGSTRENPAANYWKILRTPTEAMENTTHLFLATRFNCNKCHDHPFERWTQDQYYHLAAFFAQVNLKEDPASRGRTIGGSDVESSKALFELVSDVAEGEIKHDRTGKVSPPDFPFRASTQAEPSAPRRARLAEWITAPDNPYFALSYANRVWGYLTGTGIIEPLDDIRAGNPPSNPELLQYLTQEFARSGFNTRHLFRLICTSRTYQLSVRTNPWNEDDRRNYSHALPRRLSAEALVDSVFTVTGSRPEFAGGKPGQMAAQLADGAADVESGLLATLGRPPRQSACECERSNDIRLGGVMALLSGPTVSGAINNSTNVLAHLAATQPDDRKLVQEVFLRVLCRPPSESEVEHALALVPEIEHDRCRVQNELRTQEERFAPEIVALEAQREKAVAQAKTNLVLYDDFTRTLRVELEKRRQASITVAERALKEFEVLLPAQAALWEARLGALEGKTSWIPLRAETLEASNGTSLSQASDFLILSSNVATTVDFHLTFRSPLTRLTGLLLEVLPDDSLPQFGPGWHPDGNFVLSELQAKWAGGTNVPLNPVKFVEARADFSQDGYPVAQAIDGLAEAGRNGWAIAGAPGIQRHVAAFKLEEPLTDTNGISLDLRLLQRWGEKLVLGRFRLYGTAGDNPLEFGYPEPVLAALRSPPGQRTRGDVASLFDFYRSLEPELWKRKQAVQAAKEPLPKDPRLVELASELERVEQPIRLNPALLSVRQAAADSAVQAQNARLTMVQDLAWALINSSAFLFNY